MVARPLETATITEEVQKTYDTIVTDEVMPTLHGNWRRPCQPRAGFRLPISPSLRKGFQ